MTWLFFCKMQPRTATLLLPKLRKHLCWKQITEILCFKCFVVLSQRLDCGREVGSPVSECLLCGLRKHSDHGQETDQSDHALYLGDQAHPTAIRRVRSGIYIYFYYLLSGMDSVQLQLNCVLFYANG